MSKNIWQNYENRAKKNVFDANLTLYEAYIIKKNAHETIKMLTLHVKSRP